MSAAGPAPASASARRSSSRTASDGHPGRGAPGDPGLGRPVEGVGEGPAPLPGPGGETVGRGVAHPPAGHVHDPAGRDLVGRVGHHPEVGEEVLHLTPVVEAGATHHLVGDRGTHQGLFERPALGVGPVEDGHVAVGAVASAWCSRPISAATQAASSYSSSARNRLTGSPRSPSVHNSFGTRLVLLTMTALAASRMVFVDR